MSNRVVIFPSTKLSSAQGYAAAVDQHYAATYEPGGKFCYVRPDVEGQHVVPYYGSPWEFIIGQGFTEPNTCIAARVDGVIHNSAIWPDEEV
jgi:hypothetical protein